MSDPVSDAALQPDMHLKPLDNAALLKPLRKKQGRASGAVSPAPPAESPAAEESAAPRIVMSAAPYVGRRATRQAKKDGGDGELFPASKSIPAPARHGAQSMQKDGGDGELYPAPKPAPAPARRGAYQADDDDEDDDLFTESKAAPAVSQPLKDRAGSPVPAQPKPASAPARRGAYQADDDDEDDDLFTESKTAPVPAAPAEAQPPDDDLSGAYQPPETASMPPYRPMDDQMHMMELMKTIFASAMNAGTPRASAAMPAAKPTAEPTTEPPAELAAEPTAEPAAEPTARRRSAPPPPEEPPSLDDLRKLLIALQQKIREAQIPVVIVIEGLSASGKGTMLSRLIEGLDSRGYKTHPIRKPNCVEQAYPAMWRYWTQMPAKGNIALFCSSWYGELNKASFERADERSESLTERLNEIISMESQLICDGTLILKLFLHITQQEQYDRLKKMGSKKSTTWQVDAHDLEQNKRYDEYVKGMDNLMSITNLRGAPWHVLDAANLKDCERQIYRIVIQAFGEVLAQREKDLRPWDVPMLPNLSPIPSLGHPPLKSIDLDKRLDKPFDDAYRALKKKLYKLQVKLYRKNIPMIVGFEGWDAAGKGGAISRLTSALDARGFTVAPIGAPTSTELAHHYMWRFWTALPPRGHITIFDRTWYGRVMVERVEKLCTVPQWQRAYEEINRFEKLLTDHGAILCKFWLQIDPDTQLKRFEARKGDPEKQWKLTDEDWRNRDKWPAYEQALEEVLQRTHTAFAPWTVVEANDKDYARIKVLKTVVDAIEKRLGRGEDDD